MLIRLDDIRYGLYHLQERVSIRGDLGGADFALLNGNASVDLMGGLDHDQALFRRKLGIDGADASPENAIA